MSHQDSVTPFNPQSVGLVDYFPGTGSLLVRGNQPLAQGNLGENCFAYAALGSALNALTAPAPVLPPAVAPFDWTDYTLVDVNLTDNQGGSIDLIEEVKLFGLAPMSNPFFASWPPNVEAWPPYEYDVSWSPATIHGSTVSVGNGQFAAGGIVYWPVPGCPPPPHLPGYGRFVNSRPGYDFAGLVTFVRSLLVTGTRRVIFLHCRSGVNRTGALSVAYFLKYGSFFFPSAGAPTLQQAYDNAIATVPQLNEQPGIGYTQLVQVFYDFLMTGSPDTSSVSCLHNPAGS